MAFFVQDRASFFGRNWIITLTFKNNAIYAEIFHHSSFSSKFLIFAEIHHRSGAAVAQRKSDGKQKEKRSRVHSLAQATFLLNKAQP
jgi:hypothetical protein